MHRVNREVSVPRDVICERVDADGNRRLRCQQSEGGMNE